MTRGRRRAEQRCGATGAPATHSWPEVSSVIEGGRPDRVFGGDTSRIAELDQVARRHPQTGLALLPGNALAIRPALNPEIVMTAEFAGVPRTPAVVPIHHRFTAGPRQGALSHA